MSKEVFIDNWSCVNEGWYRPWSDPYANEFVALAEGVCLHGRVQGHARIDDGHRAVSSIIKTISYCPILFTPVSVVTESGTLYRLGARSKEYDYYLLCRPSVACNA